MMKKKMTGVMAFVLAILMSLGAFTFGVSAAEGSSSGNGSGTITNAELVDLLRAGSYTNYLERYKDVPNGADEDIVINAADFVSYEGSSQSGPTVGTYGGVDNALYLPDSGKVTWKVNVPVEGKYSILFEYYSPTIEGKSENVSSIERSLYINGKIPFSEARSLVMSKVWTYQYPTDANGENTFKEDVNGNQLRPSASHVAEWNEYIAGDPNGFFTGAFQFCFNKGENTIALECVREDLVLKSITLTQVDDLPTYSEVLEQYKANGYKPASSSAMIYMEAEFPSYVSDTSIYPSNNRTSAITSPSSPSAELLNVIGGNSYDTVGQWAKYNFKVTESGLYTIVLRYNQTALEGLFTSRTIKINGEVPFAEAYNTRFDYSKDWQVAPLGDGEQVFEFYFEAGKDYELTLEVSLGQFASVIEEVERILKVINESYLSIIQLTGADPDEYRDYDFTTVMPKTVRSLLQAYLDISAVSEELTALSDGKGSHVATLDKIAELLERMGSNDDEIPSNLSQLKSYIGTLGTWINDSKKQSLIIDYIQIQPKGAELPRATAGFFESLAYEFKSFFASFTVDYNNMGVTNTTETTTSVEVWLADGRDQAKIWRSLIDNYFTPETNIAINMKLVAGGTLLPSVLAQRGPDVYQGLGSGDVINYAIRSAVLSLNGLEGLEEVKQNFNAAALVPITLYGETYGLPATSSFPMMFYRLDILAELEVDVPKTWDDLLALVPILQANNMDIGLVNDPEIFIYQFGGDRWDNTLDDPGLKTGMDSNISLEAFEYFCRFYTMYSFPKSFDGANRFRTGEMPILIQDYVGTYNQLTVFATEIKGLWEFAPLPGVPTYDEDGNITSINNVSIAGVSAIVMLNGVEDKDASWKYMKWFVGADIQASYGNDMVSLIGPSAKYASANMNAIQNLSWNAREYASLGSQFNNLAAIPNYPGSYIFGRYTNFAFLAAYNNNADPIEELQSYINIINKEITRKREEFGLATYESLGSEE